MFLIKSAFVGKKAFSMLIYCGCGIDEGGFVPLLVTVKRDFLSDNGKVSWQEHKFSLWQDSYLVEVL